ncbi:uncharacterized protein CIMG_13265 [Coccidioides immitis RS]|uniref:Uncharacterized protein n=1 Tax=Coccidioides immitis (strain RS) TaxID=246410 RepID=J3K4V5_COCIM|nr:uncharacterized protein CIMG_13265 [Coccidioides immitis RS]EAS29377.3 hypothetical protein CIMG_13265 [Coccidioides immitis RS]
MLETSLENGKYLMLFLERGSFTSAKDLQNFMDWKKCTTCLGTSGHMAPQCKQDIETLGDFVSEDRFPSPVPKVAENATA